MKSVRMVGVGRPLEDHDVPVPHLGDHDVLVRVRAAGVCHSDVHYRDGTSPVHPLPLTLGHEVAGVVEAVGPGVSAVRVGGRVCLHYLVVCGNCPHCAAGREQFCPAGKMLGHHTDGGFAEFIAVPQRNVVALPDEVSFEHGATLMCAAATSLHALRKSRLAAGETVAVFGVGGLGMSALQLARALGALDVFAVDLNPNKLALAEKLGAIPVDAGRTDPVAALRQRTAGRGVDVALEMVGLAQTMRQAVQSLAVQGRAVLVGIGKEPLQIDTYTELLGKEAEVIGSNDHLLPELPVLVEFARRGVLDLSGVVSRTVPLQAQAINAVLDDLGQFGDAVRTVVTP